MTHCFDSAGLRWGVVLFAAIAVLSACVKAALVACKGKLPLRPPEMDAGKKPRYLDDYRDRITCLKVEQDCEMEAFSGK